MTARLLGPGDAALWRTLWAEALAEAPTAFARRPEGSAAARPEAVAARLASLRAFVWEAPGAVPERGPDPAPGALACALWCRDDDPSAPHRGWIEAVFVRPHARGRGLAGRLLEALAADARAHGVRELWLEVGRANAAALAAYARAGFAVAPAPAGRADEIALCRRLDRRGGAAVPPLEPPGPSR